MAKVEVTIPNLIPGKRYRMLIEPKDLSAVGPSIEFVVPGAPRLLSTYQPSFNVIEEPWSTSTTTTTTVPGATVLAGSIRAGGAASKTISGWQRGNNLNPPYRFYVNNTTDLYVGQPFTVYKMSNPAGGDYYDRLNYTVHSIPNSTTVWATATIPNPAPSGFTRSWKDAKGAPLLKDTTTSNNGDLNYTLSPLPATNQTAASTEKTTTTTTSGKYYHVDLKVPSEITSSLVNETEIVDIPIFFYIKNKLFYYLDNSVMTTSVQSLSSKPTTIQFTKRNENIGSQSESEARDYRFTIARYEKQGSSWVGDWLQKDETYDTIGPSLNRIIYSQSAVKSSG